MVISHFSRNVVKLDPSSGHCVQCVMEWESAEAFAKMVASQSGVEMTADIKNYTSGTPTIFVGDVVGNSLD